VSVAGELDRLLRPSVLGMGPYVPASAQETRARLDRDDLVRLNWNENIGSQRRARPRT
jgi:hypothetical protein